MHRAFGLSLIYLTFANKLAIKLLKDKILIQYPQDLVPISSIR